MIPGGGKWRMKYNWVGHILDNAYNINRNSSSAPTTFHEWPQERASCVHEFNVTCQESPVELASNHFSFTSTNIYLSVCESPYAIRSNLCDVPWSHIVATRSNLYDVPWSHIVVIRSNLYDVPWSHIVVIRSNLCDVPWSHIVFIRSNPCDVPWSHIVKASLSVARPECHQMLLGVRESPYATRSDLCYVTWSHIVAIRSNPCDVLWSHIVAIRSNPCDVPWSHIVATRSNLCDVSWSHIVQTSRYERHQILRGRIIYKRISTACLIFKGKVLNSHHQTWINMLAVIFCLFVCFFRRSMLMMTDVSLSWRVRSALRRLQHL